MIILVSVIFTTCLSAEGLLWVGRTSATGGTVVVHARNSKVGDMYLSHNILSTSLSLSGRAASQRSTISGQVTSVLLRHMRPTDESV